MSPLTKFPLGITNVARTTDVNATVTPSWTCRFAAHEKFVCCHGADKSTPVAW
jgi:hypothetical protein